MTQSQGVLSGKAILAAIDDGKIKIDPFDHKYMNPASFDLTLGNEVKVYEAATKEAWWATKAMRADGRALRPRRFTAFDSKVALTTRSYKIGPEGWLLKPGIGYLMHTRERVWTDSYEPVLDGKSSIGRLFVKVHETAGYGEPGFDGQYTLEVTCVHPVRVYTGMRFCQIRFHTIVGEVVQYSGRYKGSQAKGAIPSRAWEQFDG